MEQSTVTISNVKLTLEQLVAAVGQLDETGRAQLARVLLQADMDAQLKVLMERLARREPVPEVSETTIQEEVAAVRQGNN